jgi:hypothetical protein
MVVIWLLARSAAALTLERPVKMDWSIVCNVRAFSTWTQLGAVGTK